MRSLRLVGLSDDGSSLVLVAEGTEPGDEGERFELPVDDRLRAAARGDARRLGQIDVDLGMSLPPRVIQARIRAGETPEQVAEAAGIRVDRVLRFAGPVLQERERIADQAREARVRLSDGVITSPLQQFMAERLRLLGSDLDAVRWDAARGSDGVWQVTAAWHAGAKSGLTRWAYDMRGRIVAPVDAATTDFAEGTRLVRVVPDVPAGLPASPLQRSRPVAVVTEQVPPAEPIEDAVPEEPAESSRRTADAEVDIDDIAEHDTLVLGRPDGDDEDPRVRVPAWEDIVFGVRRHR
ncbi:septation protein SepH [Blastococcus sp. URHD0036]|uniref:septation protein SepH n=1 Tax=Blastococcus sp. URHD0036 TaxID=1380356 RepID=UPI00055603CB|nr:septation protein SepH [Blastococcus sp. URHD0036]